MFLTIYFILFFFVSCSAGNDVTFLPYDAGRDALSVEKLMWQNYYDIFTNSVGWRAEKYRKGDIDRSLNYFKRLQALPNDSSKVLVARLEDETVGYVHYGVNHHQLLRFRASQGWLYQLAVAARCRGHDYGTMLCQKALQDFKQQNLLSVVVMTTSPNDLGEKFYKNKLGFYHQTRYKTPTGVEDKWRKNLREPETLTETLFGASYDQKHRFFRSAVRSVFRK
ncbi:GNAT family N-acetyltransferase [Candidatus Babeliales bacterium]|nr:GNAT family N-acetyltransferase [Candidatus Babeliales bacterium]